MFHKHKASYNITLIRTKSFMFVKMKVLRSCKYNIILLIRRIILYKDCVCENKNLRSCKYNIILLIRRIILYKDCVCETKSFMFVKMKVLCL